MGSPSVSHVDSHSAIQARMKLGLGGEGGGEGGGGDGGGEGGGFGGGLGGGLRGDGAKAGERRTRKERPLIEEYRI